MVCGEARRLRRQDEARVRPLNRKKRPYWHQVFQYCPDMGRGGRHHLQNMIAGPGCRPYIDYQASTPERWVWQDYDPEPAQLKIPARKIKTGRILIEPNLKPRAPRLKQWGWENWLALLDYGFEFVQIGAPGTRKLPGVQYIPTRSLLEAFRVVSGCVAAVLPEGGLHHACAAFGIPAVVLYGGYITPHQTGYDGQIALWVDDPDAQGWRVPYERAEEVWAPITPDLVARELEHLLDETAQGRLPTGRRAALTQDDVAWNQAIRGTAGRSGQLPEAQVPQSGGVRH